MLIFSLFQAIVEYNIVGDRWNIENTSFVIVQPV